MSSAAERVSARGPELQELLAGVSRGDGAALASFFDRTRSYVYGLSLRILGEKADAEEVTLDVYTQVWRQPDRFDPARGEVLTWLLTLTRSRAIDRLRSRAGERRRSQELGAAEPVADGAPDPESNSELLERSDSVRRALRALPPEQRKVIELAYFEGLTHVEIAERLGQPLGTAKSRIRLALVRLRDALACHAPEAQA